MRLIRPTDVIEVKQICALLYGQPGSRKSSCAQTARNPITLATDPGIYRAYGRKTAVEIETWADVKTACELPEALAASTIVIDTLGMLLDKLAIAIINDNAKHGNRMGGLTLQGYGVLKAQFSYWVASMKAMGKDLVFLCHEKVEKNGDEAYYCPDIVGGSYNTLMNIADMVGYMHFEAGKRVVDFMPTDRWMAKTPPCGWKTIPLPDFGAKPDFLDHLMAEAKASMGQVSAESAKITAIIDGWRAKLDPLTVNLDSLNEIVKKDFKEFAEHHPALKHQVWALIVGFANENGCRWDAPNKHFITEDVR